MEGPSQYADAQDTVGVKVDSKSDACNSILYSALLANRSGQNYSTVRSVKLTRQLVSQPAGLREVVETTSVPLSLNSRRGVVSSRTGGSKTGGLVLEGVHALRRVEHSAVKGASHSFSCSAAPTSVVVVQKPLHECGTNSVVIVQQPTRQEQQLMQEVVQQQQQLYEKEVEHQEYLSNHLEHRDNDNGAPSLEFKVLKVNETSRDGSLSSDGAPYSMVSYVCDQTVDSRTVGFRSDDSCSTYSSPDSSTDGQVEGYYSSEPSSNCSSPPLPDIMPSAPSTFNVRYHNDSLSVSQVSIRSMDSDSIAHPVLKRSVSDDRSYCRLPQVADENPLDLSMSRCTSLPQEPIVPRPRPSLMQLADAACYFIENDPQTCQTFHSSSSSPSSLCDSSSTQSSYIDEKADFNVYQCEDDSQQPLLSSESYGSLEKVKYEVSDSFHPDGIILNSNVLTDNVNQSSPTPFTSVVVSKGGCPVSNGMQTVSDNAMTTFIKTELVEQLVTVPKLQHRFGKAPMLAMRSLDSKRRLRLHKSEYESMSEEARRVRHRVLDNERSKQYRERRRMLVNTLGQEFECLTVKNIALKRKLKGLESKISKISTSLRLYEIIQNNEKNKRIANGES